MNVYDLKWEDEDVFQRQVMVIIRMFLIFQIYFLMINDDDDNTFL